MQAGLCPLTRTGCLATWPNFVASRSIDAAIRFILTEIGRRFGEEVHTLRQVSSFGKLLPCGIFPEK
ncbi:unnamed protein product [Rodentolepis nana]|uniref:Transcriptional regulator n=1 Tax=Rodentolepis nana TaxID=102285 RepID=A0A0R3T4E2_RODNA|nr:unnamed protein product [Rodentolepis nana]